MLTGARKRTTGIIGQRNTPTPSTVARVTARGPALATRELHELQPSSEGEPNGGSCNAIEDGVNRRALIDPCVTHG